MSKKRKTGFDIGDIKKKSFRYREETRAVAAPVAHYSIPTKQDGDMDALRATLSNLAGVTKYGIKQRKEYQQKKGLELAARRDARPTPSFFNQDTVDAYDLFNGAADVPKIKGHLNALHKQHVDGLNSHSDINTADYGKLTTDYEQAVKKTLDKLLEKKPQAYISGLQEEIAIHESRLQATYERKQLEHLQGLGLSNLIRIAEDKSTSIKEDAAAVNTDPTAYWDTVAKNNRTLLSETHDLGSKLYQLDKSTISKRFLNVRIQEAVLNGEPENLLFMSEPDAAGVRLMDNEELRNEAFQGFKQAMATKETKIAKANKIQKEAEDAAITDIERNLSTAIGAGLRDKKTLNNLKQVLFKYGDNMRNPQGIAIDPTRLDHYWGAINSLEADEDFQRYESNSAVHMDLKLRAADGEDVLGALVSKKGFLTRDHFEEVLKDVINAKGSIRKGASGKMSQLDKSVEDAKTELSAALLQIKDIAGLEKRLDPAKTFLRKQVGVLKFRELVTQRKALKDEPFTFGTVQEIFNAARAYAYQRVPIEKDVTGTPMYDPRLQQVPKWYAGQHEGNTNVKNKQQTPKFDSLFESVN